MNRAQLLRELDPLSHDERMRRISLFGRQTDSKSSAVIDELWRGEVYERMLALQSAYGSRNGALVLAALADPSALIRGRALNMAALVCSDEQIAQALITLQPRTAAQLLGKLARARRTAPIDALIATTNGPRLSYLLPLASAALARQRAPQAAETANSIDMARLAKHHPTIAADTLLARARAATAFDQRLLWLANAALPPLARSLPDQALALVGALLPHVALHRLALGELARRRPAQVADLVLGTTEDAGVDMARIAAHLDLERLAALARRGLLRRVPLERLPPAARAAVFDAAGAGWRDANGATALAQVAALPTAQRVPEARRNLALPALAAAPLQRLPYAGLLPWDEARTVLEPFLGSPDPDIRAVALPTLIRAARYEARLDDVVQLVTARRNEQDPVRQQMLAALNTLPPSRWRAEHLPALGQIIRDALNAADCSTATASMAEQLVIRLLPFHPGWSAEWLATLGRERGWLTSYSLEKRLANRDVERIAPALLPVVRSWQPRERYRAVFRVASMVGKRIVAFPALLAILEEITADPRADVSAQALNQIAAVQPARLATLVPKLLRADRSWVTQPAVYQFLHRRRQDLLTPLLGQTAYKGRFSSGKTRFVLPLIDGFVRWTPAQQAQFAQVLTQLVRDEERDSPALFQAIEQLAALPFVPPATLLALAALGNQRTAVRDRALQALGRLDAGQGLPTLLAALDDDRARIAIYALRSSLLAMPPAQALPLLRGVPLRKISVAKETVRLIGELPGDDAYRALLDMAGEALHRDVRVALLRALWDHLDRATTWPLLETAAADHDPAVASGVIRIPAERLPADVVQRLAALLASLLAHPDAKVRQDTLQRCATLPLSDPARTLQGPLLAALGSPLPAERTFAAQALFATYVGNDAAIVGQAVTTLLPNRRALQSVLHALNGVLPWNRTRLVPAVTATLAALAPDPRTAAQQVELAITAQQWDVVLALLHGFAARGILHADVIHAADTALRANARSISDNDLLALEQTLTASDDQRLRRIALAALCASAQTPRTWDPARLERLRQFRHDPAPLVAAAAQWTLPTEEEMV